MTRLTASLLLIASPLAAAPTLRPPPPKADFDELTVAIRPPGISNEPPSTVRVRGDGTCVYEVAGQPAAGTRPAREPVRTTHTLPADRVRRLNALIKDTDWLGKPPAKGPPALHASGYAVTLRRNKETVARDGWYDPPRAGRVPEPYQAVVAFAHALARQEALAARLESGPAADRAAARYLLDTYVRAELGEPQGKPGYEFDFARFAPWAVALVRKPADHPADDVAAAVRLVGLLKPEDERDGLARLAGHEDGNVRNAVARALGRLGGEASAKVLARMVGDTSDAPWELVRLGPVAVPVVAEVIRTGTDPERIGYEKLIRAYLDHWAEVPKPVPGQVLDAVRTSMAAPKVKAFRTEYHRELLKKAEDKQ
jgi:hypothetical protein